MEKNGLIVIYEEEEVKETKAVIVNIELDKMHDQAMSRLLNDDRNINTTAYHRFIEETRMDLKQLQIQRQIQHEQIVWMLNNGYDFDGFNINNIVVECTSLGMQQSQWVLTHHAKLNL